MFDVDWTNILCTQNNHTPNQRIELEFPAAWAFLSLIYVLTYLLALRRVGKGELLS